MIKGRFPLVLAAAAVLGGCALPVVRAADQGLTWRRNDRPTGELQLVLGGAEGTDDVELIMACRPRSGAVDLTAVGSRRAGAVLELHSGAAWNRYPGAGIEDNEADGFDVQVRLAAIDPVLQAFADTGDLTVLFDQRRFVATHDFARAHDFMRACALP